MVRQKTFTLVRPTLALDVVDGKQRIVTIPAEAIIVVRAGAPDRSGLIKVSWDARTLLMFAVDPIARGIEMTEPVPNAGRCAAAALPSATGIGALAG